LLIGIISGTYSSIFNASVLLVWWKQRDLGENIAAPVGGVKRNAPVIAPSTINRNTTDRPLITPSSGVTLSKGTSSTSNGEGGDNTPRTPRRQPTRRRRM